MNPDQRAKQLEKELQPQLGNASSSGAREERKSLLGSIKNKIFGERTEEAAGTNYEMSPEAKERFNPADKSEKNLTERVKDAVGMSIPSAPVISSAGGTRGPDEEIRGATGIFKEPTREYLAEGGGNKEDGTHTPNLMQRAREATGILREQLEQQKQLHQQQQPMEERAREAVGAEGVKGEGMLDRAKHAMGFTGGSGEDPARQQAERMKERSEALLGKRREGEELVERSKEAWGMGDGAGKPTMEERGREVMGLGAKREDHPPPPRQEHMHHEGETMNLMDRAKEALGMGGEKNLGEKASQRAKEAMGWDSQSAAAKKESPWLHREEGGQGGDNKPQEMRKLEESFQNRVGFDPSNPVNSSSSSQEQSVESSSSHGAREGSGGDHGGLQRFGHWKSGHFVKAGASQHELTPNPEPGLDRLTKEREMDETIPQYDSSSSSSSEGKDLRPLGEPGFTDPILTPNKTGGRQTSESNSDPTRNRDSLGITHSKEEGKQKWSSVSLDKMKEKLGWGTGGLSSGGLRPAEATPTGGVVTTPEDTVAPSPHGRQTDDRRAVFSKGHLPSVDKEGNNLTGTGAASSPFKIGDKAADQAARAGVTQSPMKKVVQANDLLNNPNEINKGRAGEGTARLHRNDMRVGGKGRL